MRLGVAEAAALLGVSTKTIYRWVAAGRLPGYRVQSRYRFDRAELLEWATAERIAVDPARIAALHHETDPIPRFDEALAWGGVAWRVGGEGRDTVLRAAVDAALRAGEPDRTQVFDALRAREELASTAIGDGFALPHIRNPLALRLPRPSISLCFLERPTDWNAPDGRPVSVLFVILAATVRAVLRLHSRTWFALRDPVFRDVVLGHGSRDAIAAAARDVAERQTR